MTTIQNSASLLTSRNSLALISFAVIAISNIGTVTSQEQRHVFGTQCSFAITGPNLDGCDPSLLDHRQNFYNDYMAGCYEHYSKYKCRAEEESRLEMNVRQPQSMVNMTSTGYRKMKAPDSLLKLLTDFWEANKGRKYIEDWGDGSIYTVSSTSIHGNRLCTSETVCSNTIHILPFSLFPPCYPYDTKQYATNQ